MAANLQNDEMNVDLTAKKEQTSVEADEITTPKLNARSKRLIPVIPPRTNASHSTIAPPTSSCIVRFSKKCKIFVEKICQLIKMAKESSISYLRRVFTLPLVRGYPISYSCPEDFNAAGERVQKKDQEEYEKAMDMLETVCNYTEKTNLMFQKIIADRKQFVVNKKKYAEDIDWSKLAPWNESFLTHLESTFQVFDSSDDALVDFEEMGTVLTDYGDKTTPEDRQKVFFSAVPGGKNALTFTEFIVMFHDITVKSPENYPNTIVESFRSIDRNMARIRGLDVVQRLQAGLF